MEIHFLTVPDVGVQVEDVICFEASLWLADVHLLPMPLYDHVFIIYLMCLCVLTFFFLKGHQSYWIGVYPKNLIP